MVATKDENKARRSKDNNKVEDMISGILVVIAATALAVWINDTFDIGGDYVEMTPDAN
jgi:hypothetical protein